MSDNQTITLNRDELAAYQRAIEVAKDQIAALTKERDTAVADLARNRAELAVVRDISTQTRAALDAERVARELSDADVSQLRTAVLAYVTSATYEERARLRAELHVLATVERPGTLLLKELKMLRELADDLDRWREAGGDIRDLTYVFETMEQYAQMKEEASGQSN